MDLFLRCLDQLRFIIGYLLLTFFLCDGRLPRRRSFGYRMAFCILGSILLALCYVPLSLRFDGLLTAYPVFTAPYWLCMSFCPLGLLLLCYETDLSKGLFFLILSSTMENGTTVFVRDFMVKSLFPTLPEEHLLWYLLLLFFSYAVMSFFAAEVMGRRILSRHSGYYVSPGGGPLLPLIIYLFYLYHVASNRSVLEHELFLLRGNPDYERVLLYTQLLIVVGMLVTSFVASFFTLMFSKLVFLSSEQKTILQLLKAREAQYEFSKENIEMIQRKSHDLKHQLRALERISDKERREKIREAREAIDFYDAVVKTGHEALDIILTEKSVFCQNRNIRLSCTVHTSHLDAMEVIDLYTLLGNALDNAIEGVERLPLEEQRVISLTVRDQGEMVYILLENYYDGKLSFTDDLPVTRKDDPENHGYGVKSMREIVLRYGGEFRINTQGQIFSLEILIPGGKR
ncbi:MAG: GHKL domain-containing protein [Blautia sp.]|nr:GHKL domain-containing protein [Blautia sp.]